MEKLKTGKMHALVKALIVILSYFIYTQLFASILSLFNINIYTNWVILLISDLLFLVFCVYAYNDDIEENSIEFKQNIKKNIVTVLKYVGLLYLITIGINIVSVIIEETFNTTITLNNNNAIDSLNIVYKAFRTLIFATLAETIVYHKTIKSLIPENKWTYLLVASIFYGTMNIIYQPLTGIIDIYILLICAIRIIPMCLLYNKTNNVVFLMAMGFIYNAIGFVISLLGGGL